MVRLTLGEAGPNVGVILTVASKLTALDRRPNSGSKSGQQSDRLWRIFFKDYKIKIGPTLGLVRATICVTLISANNFATPYPWFNSGPRPGRQLDRLLRIFFLKGL